MPPAVLEAPKPQQRVFPDEIPPLENGDHLAAAEFLRRYEAMPEVKKAELIQGVVYLMASPVRIDLHGDPDSLAQGWLFTYAAHTRGVKSSTNATNRLGPDDIPQPDGMLRLLPQYGGQAKVDAKGYLCGAAELVVEVAASSASVDTREKFTTYRRARVQEYLVWRTRDQAVDWWVMEDDEYLRLEPDADGILRSRTFPGLWLNVPALIAEDSGALLATLQQGLASEAHQAFNAALAAKAAAQS
ncbi:MAG: Uma2 family endonuclease [Prosthecobacter sp.]|uniref:Uma2 family endonuclease n=1 Tax=Prosthecobacter sp. TaxID=1965333 RepID=UPI0038FD76E1